MGWKCIVGDSSVGMTARLSLHYLEEWELPFTDMGVTVGGLERKQEFGFRLVMFEDPVVSSKW